MLSDFEQKILDLWNKNLSTSLIAAELKVTKNMVCGQVYRMRKRGVSIRPRALRIEGAHKRRQIRGSDGGEIISIRPQREAPLLDWMFQKSQKKQPMPKPREALEAEPINIKFKDLTSMSCRYVVNDGRPENFIFCGALKERGPYCGAHARICYNVPNYEQRREIKRAVRFN